MLAGGSGLAGESPNLGHSPGFHNHVHGQELVGSDVTGVSWG